jgi:lysophospholipase L1-like esterase
MNEHTNEKMKKEKIVIIGDSFVQGVGDESKHGWAKIFKKKFEHKYNILIKGFGGNNIYNVLSRIKRDLIPYQPHFVILEVGINDSRLRKSLGFSNETKIDNFTKGLREFVDGISQSLILKPHFIFIGTTPVVDEITNPYKEDKYYSTEESRKYNKIIYDFCKSHKLLFIDVFESFMKVGNLRNILADGLHPNSKGYRIIAREVINKFVKEFIET